MEKKFIFKVLLCGSFFLCTLAITILLIEYYLQGVRFKGIHPSIALLILTLIIFTALLVKLNALKASAYLLMGLMLLPAFFLSIQWGALVPQALLIYALGIIVAGILLNSKAAFIVLAIITTFLITIAYLQSNSKISVDLSWKNNAYDIEDAIVAAGTLLIIFTVSWLYNQEIKKAFNKVKTSEKMLRIERDLLELKVQLRTRELKKAQREKLLQVNRFVELGRLASGIFHDVSTPLTVLSLNLEQIQSKSNIIEAAELNKEVERAIDATKRIEQFILIVKKQLQCQEPTHTFSPVEEIENVINLLRQQARDSSIQIKLQADCRSHLYGNNIKFFQLMKNLILNAIDSYEDLDPNYKKNQTVIIKLTENKAKLNIQIIDNGAGIPEENITRIFDPFFTTKPASKAMGLGLSICKDIVEKDFGGNIFVQSAARIGTKVTVEVPVLRNTQKEKH